MIVFEVCRFHLAGKRLKICYSGTFFVNWVVFDGFESYLLSDCHQRLLTFF